MYSDKKFEEIRYFSDQRNDIIDHMTLKQNILVSSWNLNLHAQKYIKPLRSSRLGEKSVFRNQSPTCTSK